MNFYLEQYPYTRIFFGVGERKRIAEICSGLGEKCLVITSRGFARKLGILDQLKSSLTRDGVQVQVFEGIEPEPCDETSLTLAESIRSINPDFLIALGGGSVIDAVKCAEALATLEVNLKEIYGSDKVSALLAQKGKSLRPLIALPSTSGTGSEVTKYAVLYDGDEKMKVLVLDYSLCPKIAIVDPELSFSAPLDLTIATGLDALTHLIESYLNHQSAPEWIARMTEEGICLILENLPRLKKSLSDFEAREKMSLASTYGGIAITYKGTGLPHGFSYAFKEIIPHGSAVALTLIPSWRYYLPAVYDKTRKLAPLFGVEPALALDEMAEAIFNKLKGFFQELGHPVSLKDIPQVSEQVLQEGVKAVMKNPSKLANAPRPVPLEQAESILNRILRD